MALLDIHHIVSRSDGGSNDPANLIVVCKNCHARIGDGTIPPDEVIRKKQSFRIIPLSSAQKMSKTNSVQINGNVTASIIANNVTIREGAKISSRMNYPVGSIGAHLDQKNYIQYLITRYYEFRDIDPSYGRNTRFHHSVIHKDIARKFRAKTFFIPEERFEDLATYLKGCIDRTIQGRVNRSQGQERYLDYEDHVRQLRGS